MAKGLLVTESIFSEVLGKDVSITVRSKENQVWHKFDGVTLLKVENQKSTGMKNAPDKRMKDAKAYTPPMIALNFSEGNNLVFVVEDFTLVARYKGVSFVFEDYFVDIVEWEKQ